MKRIVFLDVTAPKAYGVDSLANEPMGGTEATVVRVAEALASTGRYEVTVAQGARSETERAKATYAPIEVLDSIDKPPHAVICIRKTSLVPIARAWKGSKVLLWLHDFNQQDLVKDYTELSKAPLTVLGVSRAHKNSIADTLLSQVKDIKNLKLDYIYNPIDDGLASDFALERTAPYLIYLASPHKGLDNTLAMFQHLRHQHPELTLKVANPGYLPLKAEDLGDGVEYIGPRPHWKVMGEVRAAFAVLHLNDVFPETFGLVHAEANAVGTPVITGSSGANSEVLDREQMVDVRDIAAISEKLSRWIKNGRPNVRAKPQFRMSAVLKSWEDKLS